MNTSEKSKKFILIVFVASLATFTAFFAKTVYETQKNTEQRIKEVTLVVFANSYFMSQFGPGPELKRNFEKICQCTVEYIDVETSVMAIEKMKLDPQRRVDVIVGLDHLLLHRAANSVRFQSIEKPQADWRSEILPKIYSRFVPYDWSPMGFVYRKSQINEALRNTKTLDLLLKTLPDRALGLTDPRMSPVGLELLYWLFVNEVDFSKHDRATLAQPMLDIALKQNLVNKLQVMQDKVQSYSPSWSATYGLFKNKQSLLTFSYLSSLIYHRKEENDYDYEFLVMNQPHPAQIEYAAVPDSCWNCGDAKKFVQFLTQPESQKILAEKNYMFPVINNVNLDKLYSELPTVQILNSDGLEHFVRYESEIIELWNTNRIQQ